MTGGVNTGTPMAQWNMSTMLHRHFLFNMRFEISRAGSRFPMKEKESCFVLHHASGFLNGLERLTCGHINRPARRQSALSRSHLAECTGALSWEMSNTTTCRSRQLLSQGTVQKCQPSPMNLSTVSKDSIIVARYGSGAGQAVAHVELLLRQGEGQMKRRRIV